MPDIRECQPGREVEFLEDGQRRHGHLIAAGPRWCFVWDSPSRPCVRVSTGDVEPVDDPDGGYDGPTTLHSGE